MANFPEKQTPSPPWGTWEDLLLSSAVARHGADSWDAVAAELRTRSSSSAALSPRTCRLKFHDLRRRFSPDDAAPASFLDELRRLRVAELRREVERHDLSIESLETKVEKLKEERERSPTADPDSAAPPPEPSVSGEKAAEKETVVEDSYDGSSETVAKKEPAKENEEIGERVAGGGGDSAESKEEDGERVCGGDSAESKEESSTSLARKKVEEPEEEEEPERSEDGKRAHSGDVESQSLVGFLEILRSHKAGSLFERRQEIQEVPSYSNAIRQHIDLETVRMRLEEGWYSNCKPKFFRDLMLIITNATVFFDKKAPISVAAAKLRPIVQREMAAHAVKPEPAVKEESPAPEAKPDPPETLVKKPKISVPLSACRKRSSIAARAASTSSSGPAVGWKPNEKSAEKAAEEVPTVKKGKKDKAKACTKSNNSSKAGTGTGTSRSVAESGKNAAGNASSGPSTRGGGGSSNENSASKPEKKENGNGSGKKQSAANFLNRMKRASPAVEPAKDSGGGGSSRVGATEPKKNNGGKGSSGSKQKEPSTPPPLARRGSGSNTKQAKEPESPAKRSVGRPSKRPAAPSPAPPAKRNKPSGESEAAASRNAKKRSRK